MKPQAETCRRAAELLLELDAARLTRALYHLEAHELVRLIEVLERAADG